MAVFLCQINFGLQSRLKIYLPEKSSQPRPCPVHRIEPFPGTPNKMSAFENLEKAKWEKQLDACVAELESLFEAKEDLDSRIAAKLALLHLILELLDPPK